MGKVKTSLTFKYSCSYCRMPCSTTKELNNHLTRNPHHKAPRITKPASAPVNSATVVENQEKNEVSTEQATNYDLCSYEQFRCSEDELKSIKDICDADGLPEEAFTAIVNLFESYIRDILKTVHEERCEKCERR